MFFKPDQNNVSEARDAVKKQLLRSLIQQVVDELGTADSVDLDADMAAILSEDSFRTSMDSLRAAVSEGVQRHLYDGLVSEVVSDLDLSTKNTESYVTAALAQADLSSFKEVIHAQTMKRLHDEVLPGIIKDESTAVASFEATEEESDEVATKASSAVACDAPEFNRAIEAAMALVQQEVASRVQERMVATDSVSSEARALLGEEPEEIQKAAALLERSLLQEVADGTKAQLHDVHSVAERARAFLRATNEIDAVEEAMRVRLFKSMAETVMGQLSDTDKVSTEAFWHLDQQHEHVRNAMSELRRQMLFTIAKETMASLADTEAVANESHDLVPASSGPMTAAAKALKDRLVSDVAREALELMKDTDTVVAQANAQMGDHEDVLRAMQGIVERHLMESLLASALSQIGTQVSGMDDAAERSFLRKAVSEIQGVQAGSVPVGLKPTEQAPSTTSAGVKPEGQAWSRLSELSGNEDAAPATKKWRINEFRPEDWDALPGAASDSKRTRVRAFPKGE